MKTGDQIKIGDDVIIKLQSERRAQLVIDAPKKIPIKRVVAEKLNKEK